MNITLICREAGISRQAYYKSQNRLLRQDQYDKEVLEMALRVRCKHPKMSCKNIYKMIKNEMLSKEIKMGRDKFIRLMVANGYHVIRKRRYQQTTNSKHNR